MTDIVGKSARLISTALLLAGIGFLLWTSLFGELPDLRQRAVIVALFVPLSVLTFPGTGVIGRVVDVMLTAGSVIGAVYVFANYWDIMLVASSSNAVEATLGVIVGITFLELARRCIGWSFALLAFFFLAWLFVGQFVPGRLGHAPISWQLLSDLLFRTTDGIWSSLIGLFSSLLAMFAVLSALMTRTEIGQTFIDVAMLLGGRFRGGPAKIAVLASALVGSVNGSAPANVAMTGTFTIPMMKRFGFSPAVAGAIEATASTGGQITPPMMGAGMFIMAEMLSIKVGQMMLAAVLPAVIFFIGVMIAVHLYAVRNGIGVLPAEEMPKAREVIRLRSIVPVALPFGILIWLVLQGKPIAYAAGMAVVAMVASYLALSVSQTDFKRRLSGLWQGLLDSRKPLVTLFALVAAAGVLVAVLNFVGLPAKISTLLLELGAGSLGLTLILAAMVVIALGMGMPTTAAYIIGASVCVVALLELGIEPLPAHLFIFFFASLSAITPPVCAAVFVAAGIADAKWGAVAWETIKIACVKYILPFAFVLHPALLIQHASPGQIAWAFIATLASVTAASIGFAKYLRAPISTGSQLAMFGWAAMILATLPYIQIIGLAAFAMHVTVLWVRAGEPVAIRDASEAAE